MLSLWAEDARGAAIGCIEFTGGMCAIGRGAGAQHRVDDPAMAEVHFALFEHGGHAYVRDLQGWGATLVNGAAIDQSPLVPGDVLSAGGTHFRVGAPLERPPAAVHDAAADADAPEAMYRERWRSMRDTVRWTLLGEPAPLFAVVDVSRDAALPGLVLESGEATRCLLPDVGESDLDEEAPYLVSLPPASPLLRALIDEGWGMGWGVFFTSERSFNDVFPFVQDLHFALRLGDDPWRFFEPAALLARLATLPGETLAGPVQAWLVEDAAEGSLVRVAVRDGGVEVERIPVGSGEE